MKQPHFFRTLLQRPIAFQPTFADLTKSVKAALLLSQAVYWSDTTTDPHGWFYKTRDEWQAETKLTREEQEFARKRLRSFAFWQEEKRGVPAKIFFRVDYDELQLALEEMFNNLQTEATGAPKRQPRRRESLHLGGGKASKTTHQSANQGGGKASTLAEAFPPPFITEITAETTSRSSTRARAREAAAAAAAASLFEETFILDYLTAIKPGNAARNPGLAHKLWLTGEDDHLIDRWQQRQSGDKIGRARQSDREAEEIFANELALAEVLTTKSQPLDERERGWAADLILSFAPRPELASTVNQLQGLL